MRRQTLIIQCGPWIRELSDSVLVKGLVLFLLLADTINSVFDVWSTYDYCVVRVRIEYDSTIAAVLRTHRLRHRKDSATRLQS